MCYSARVKASLKELSFEFRAQLDMESFEDFFRMRLKTPELKWPIALDRYFLHSREPKENKFSSLILKFHDEEKDRLALKLKEAESERKELLQQKQTAAIKKKIETREKKITKLQEKMGMSVEDTTPVDDRIYPYYFAPVILVEGEKTLMRPLRYRVRALDGSEVPNQYNVFNARLDSLTHARTWKSLIGKNHAIFPFLDFFEWVERDGKKKEISFHPKDRELMWAASLFSYPKSSKVLPYGSFAMITDDPPIEVAEAGHDRCPIFLQKEKFSDWLHPLAHGINDLIALLQYKEKPYYIHKLVT